MQFFNLFSSFFTINYDPLLYRFLLNFKSTKNDIDQSFISDLREINSQEISDFEFPLKALTKRDVISIARKIFYEKGLYKTMNQNDYFNALKIIRDEIPKVQINDGFTIQAKGKHKSTSYMRWDKSRKSKQNIFYLHGALNIYTYKPKKEIRKYILNKGSKDKNFINEIIEQSTKGNHFCVFEKKSKEKKEKIKNNIYLNNCLEKLSKIEGALVILGWSCSKNDKHLIDIINKSKLDVIYISYYSLESVKKLQTVFKNKQLVFFSCNILPFSKQSKRKVLQL